MKNRIVWLMAATLIALMMFSGAVFAEGEEPATVPTAEPAPDVVEEPAPAPAEATVVEPVEEPVVEPAVVQPVEETVVVEQPAAEAAVTEAAPEVDSVLTEDAPASEVVAALAEADIVLVDAEGDAIDMASIETTELLIVPDPYFYIGGVLHGYGSVTDAINAIIAFNKVPDGGMVYVEDGTYVEDVTIDGTVNSILKNLKGLKSENGSALTTIDGTVTLNGLMSGFTLQGFTITEGVIITDSTGALVMKDLKVSNPAGTGIRVGEETAPDTYDLHSGKVTLTDVESSGNLGSGAEIYSTSGSVTITNSAFDNNGEYGLRMHVVKTGVTSPAISINYVSASFNDDDNVHISKYQAALTIKNSVFNGSVNGSGLYAVSTSSGAATFDTLLANNNDNYGIRLETNGLVSLTNVEASGSVNQTGLYLWHTQRTSQISITNSRFSYNGASSLGDETIEVLPSVDYIHHNGSGLEIYTIGNILLTSITANYNHNEGIYADSCLWLVGDCIGSGYVSISSPLSSGLAGLNHFDHNDKNGVQVASHGTAYLNNFTADWNLLDGVSISTIGGNGSIVLNTTLANWSNSANNNTNNGILMSTVREIWLNNTSASGNTWNGVFSNTNSKYVQISLGDFNFNGISGIDITTMGSVLLSEVEAIQNTNFGITIDNDAVDTGMTVTMTRTVAEFNNAGIYVTTNGSTTFGRVNANNNVTYGALVEGCFVEGCMYPATFRLYSTFENNFNDNGTFGLDVRTWGSIDASNVNALGNGSWGIRLDNDFTGLTSGVTMLNTKYQFISSNVGDGLYIQTNGAITLTDIDSSVNGGYGAFLFNTGATAKTMTLTNCTFDNNGDTGLYAINKGPVLINSVRASNNNVGANGSGAYINNTDGAVTITSSTRGMSIFNNNDDYGVEIISTQAVTLKNMLADDNDLDGAKVNANGNVSISGNFPGYATSFSNNGGSGLYVDSLGTITVSSYVQANNNLGGAGIDLYNQSSTSAKSIIVNNAETNGNFTNGVSIYANGTVTLSNLEGSDNGDSGLYVDNIFGLFNGNVTMTGYNLFTNNNDYGLEIYTPKAASVSGVTAEYNGLSGIYIESASGTTKVLNSILRYNEGNGVEINANNAVYLSGVKSLSNGILSTSGSGLLVDTGGFNLTLRDSAFIGNYDYGFDYGIGAGVLSMTNVGYFGNNLGGGAGNIGIH